MYTADEVRNFIEQLRQASIRAMDGAKFEQGAELANAARILQSWLDEGLAGDAPFDPVLFLQEHGLASTTQPEETQPTVITDQPEEEPPVSAMEPAVSPKTTEHVEAATAEEKAPKQAEPKVKPQLTPYSEADLALVKMLDDARSKADQGDYTAAEADLEALLAGATDVSLQKQAQSELDKVRAARQNEVKRLVQRAQKAEQEAPKDLRGQQRAWEAVLRLDPDNALAGDALARLSQRTRTGGQRQQIETLKGVLQSPTRRKDYAEVHKAWSKAGELIDGQAIADPDLRRELEETYKKLGDIRDEILRISEGGASNERAGKYEKAINRYQDAIRRGYQTIADDMDFGEFIDPQVALKRTREAYDKDLIQRASWRYNDAEKALQDGYPETAVSLLEEATDLLGKVGEGGGDVRTNVEKLLGRANERLRNKDMARQLVSDAETEQDPESARRKLIEAKQHYPDYPDIDDLIRSTERRVLAQVVRDMAVDLSAARGALGGAGRGRFKKARERCRAALRRGSNLTETSDDLESRRKEAEEVLKTIDEQEADYGDLMEILHKVDQALESGEIRMARNKLVELGEEKQADPEVADRRERLAFLQDDDSKYAEAERFFYEDHDYKRVIKLCKELGESPAFRDRANVLRYRAQSRLWIEEAEASYRQGDLDKAISIYHDIQGLHGLLPEEDQSLIQEATDKEEQLDKERKKSTELKEQLDAAKRLRTESEHPEWKKWHEQVEKLRKDAPRWLIPRIEQELTKGTEDWKDAASREARSLFHKGDVRDAYHTLQPLRQQGFLDGRDSLWRKVQYAFYKEEAGRLLQGGYDPKDLEEAEKMAEKARQVATADKTREAGDFFLQTIRDAVLGQASIAAATSNPGPAGSVDILKNKMELYPQLSQDGKVRSRLLQYLLDTEAYGQAIDQAKAMAYVRGEEGVALLWEQLVKAAQAFAGGSRTESANSLVRIDRRLADGKTSSDNLETLYRYVKERVLASLREEAEAMQPHAGERDIAKRVQALDLILELDPQNQEATASLQQMAGRLEDMVRPRQQRIEGLKLRRSLEQSLHEGTTVLAEAQSLQRALELVHSNSAESFKRRVADLAKRVGEWQQAFAILDRLQEHWDKSIAGTWATDPLKNTLEEIALKGAVVEEVDAWEQRIGAFDKAVGETKALVDAVNKAWETEEFDAVIDDINALQTKLQEYKVVLGEERLSIPEGWFNYYDPFRGSTVIGLPRLQEVTIENRDNLRRWQAWDSGFRNQLKRALQDWKDIEEWLGSTPPCLSKSLEKMKIVGPLLKELLERVDERPEKALSRKAKKIADKAPPDTQKRILEERIKKLEEKERWAREEIQRVEEPLKRLHKFVDKGRPLSRKRNRNTLRKLIEEVEVVDSCHPDVEKFRDLMTSFE